MGDVISATYIMHASEEWFAVEGKTPVGSRTQHLQTSPRLPSPLKEGKRGEICRWCAPRVSADNLEYLFLDPKSGNHQTDNRIITYQEIGNGKRKETGREGIRIWRECIHTRNFRCQPWVCDTRRKGASSGPSICCY